MGEARRGTPCSTVSARFQHGCRHLPRSRHASSCLSCCRMDCSRQPHRIAHSRTIMPNHADARWCTAETHRHAPKPFDSLMPASRSLTLSFLRRCARPRSSCSACAHPVCSSDEASAQAVRITHTASVQRCLSLRVGVILGQQHVRNFAYSTQLSPRMNWSARTPEVWSSMIW